jgi:hypothetical protein
MEETLSPFARRLPRRLQELKRQERLQPEAPAAAQGPRPRAARRALELRAYSEATRRAIYDHAIQEYFVPKEVDGKVWDPIWEPLQAQLQVVEQDEQGQIALRTI